MMKYSGILASIFGFAVLLANTSAYAAAPVAVDDARTTALNSSVTINVLANDFDQDGDGISVASAGNGEHGTTRINSDGSIVYTPESGFRGNDSFIYAIQENTEESLTATASVTITVQESLTSDFGAPTNLQEFAKAFSGYCNNLRALNSSERGSRLEEMVARCDSLDELAGTPDNLLAALDQIAPEETLSMLRSTQDSSRRQTGVVSQRIAHIHANGPAFAFNGMNILNSQASGGAAGDGDSLWSSLGAFMSVQVEKTEREQALFENGYETDGTSFTLGVDYRLGANSVIGAAFGINEIQLEYAENAGKFDSSINTGIVFGAWTFGRFSLESQLGYSQMSYESERYIRYSDQSSQVNLTALGETRGTQYLFSTQAQWEWAKQALTLYPFIRIDALQNKLEAYEELGVAGYSVGIDEQKSTQVTGSAGVQASYALKFNWGVLLPTFQVSTLSEIESDRDDVTGYFIFDTDSTNKFAWNNEGGDSSYYQFSVGSSAVFKHGFSGFFQYQQIVGYEYFDAWQLQAGVRLEL